MTHLLLLCLKLTKTISIIILISIMVFLLKNKWSPIIMFSFNSYYNVYIFVFTFLLGGPMSTIEKWLHACECMCTDWPAWSVYLYRPYITLVMTTLTRSAVSVCIRTPGGRFFNHVIYPQFSSIIFFQRICRSLTNNFILYDMLIQVIH